MPEYSEKGVFFDTKNSRVVDGPPEEGVQLVAPGGELTDAAKAEVARYRRDMEVGGEPSEPETVTTASVKGDSEPAAEPEPAPAPKASRSK